MKVKVDQFCALATSPAWQAWLFHYNKQLYQQFYKRLASTRGCNQNRDLMAEMLQHIDVAGGGPELIKFLQRQYPHMLIKDQAVTPVEPVTTVFVDYVPGLLTYPRRLVLTGEKLEQRVREFALGKLQFEFVIVAGVAYIEFLTVDDASIVVQIPSTSWLVPQWRAKYGSS